MDLTAVLGADSSQVVKECKKAKRELDSYARSVKTSSGSATTGMKNTSTQLQNTAREYNKLGNSAKNANSHIKGIPTDKIVKAREAINKLSQSYSSLKDMKNLGNLVKSGDTKGVTDLIRNVNTAKSSLSSMGRVGSKALGFISSSAVTASASLGGVLVAMYAVYKEGKKYQQLERNAYKSTRLHGNEGMDALRMSSNASETYGVDANEYSKAVLAGAKSSKQSFEEVGKELNLALAHGLDSNSLDYFREYSQQISKAQMSTEKFLSLQIAFKNEGIFNDKGEDSIKEFFLRFEQGEKNCSQALDELGLNSHQMATMVASGAMTEDEALDKVMVALSKVTNETDKARYMSMLMGATGEDAGIRMVDAYMKAKNEGFNLKKQTDSVVKSELELDNANRHLENSWNKCLAPLRHIADAWDEWMNGIKSGILEWCADAIDTIYEKAKRLGIILGESAEPSGGKITRKQAIGKSVDATKKAIRGGLDSAVSHATTPQQKADAYNAYVARMLKNISTQINNPKNSANQKASAKEIKTWLEGFRKVTAKDFSPEGIKATQNRYHSSKVKEATEAYKFHSVLDESADAKVDDLIDNFNELVEHKADVTSEQFRAESFRLREALKNLAYDAKSTGAELNNIKSFFKSLQSSEFAMPRGDYSTLIRDIDKSIQAEKVRTGVDFPDLDKAWEKKMDSLKTAKVDLEPEKIVANKVAISVGELGSDFNTEASTLESINAINSDINAKSKQTLDKYQEQIKNLKALIKQFEEEHGTDAKNYTPEHKADYDYLNNSLAYYMQGVGIIKEFKDVVQDYILNINNKKNEAIVANDKLNKLPYQSKADKAYDAYEAAVGKNTAILYELYTKMPEIIKLLTDEKYASSPEGVISSQSLKPLLDTYTKGLTNVEVLKGKARYEYTKENKKNAQVNLGKGLLSGTGDAFNQITSLGSAWQNLNDTLANQDGFQQVGTVAEMIVNSLQAVVDMFERVNAIIQLFSELSSASASKRTAEAEMVASAKLTEGAVDSSVTATEIANDEAETSASLVSTSAKSGEAIAGATSSGASLPFPYNIVAIGAGVAAVIAALAMCGTFADGGIVGGGRTVGDYNLARVNGGEMILNGTQQARLFSVLNGTRNLNSEASTQGKVKFEIKGTRLVGVLSNQQKKQSRL